MRFGSLHNIVDESCSWAPHHHPHLRSYVAIKSYKWQLLAGTLIHQGGVRCWPLPKHFYSSLYTLWTSTDMKMTDRFFHYGLLMPLPPKVNIGICHSNYCILGLHNCWLAYRGLCAIILAFLHDGAKNKISSNPQKLTKICRHLVPGKKRSNRQKPK